jgi:hypothetical protein
MSDVCTEKSVTVYTDHEQIKVSFSNETVAIVDGYTGARIPMSRGVAIELISVLEWGT